MEPIRLQLAIAQSGLSSRRHAEELIKAGRVSVNGAIVTEMGVKVVPGQDEIRVDGKLLQGAPSRHTTVMLNKPAGWLSAASDGHGGRVATDLVRDVAARLVPVGRLDKDSCGLLLLSDDGSLIERLTHPRYGHRKTYIVEVSGVCDEPTLAALRGEMTIDGYRIRPVKVEPSSKKGRHTLLQFTLGEGRNRQIRKMCAAVGLNVVHLERIAIDGLKLGSLKPGQWRELSRDEIEVLLRGKAENA